MGFVLGVVAVLFDGQTVQFGGEGGDKFSHGFGLHEVLAQRVQYLLLDPAASDASLVDASSTPTGGRAGEIILVQGTQRFPPATSAEEFTRQ